MTTLRLLIPEWHGGVNPYYVLGSHILSAIVPPSDTAETVGNLLADLSAEADLVGLTIAEHLPWDAFRLRKTLSKIPIFG